MKATSSSFSIGGVCKSSEETTVSLYWSRTPLVGREKESKQLEDALHRTKRKGARAEAFLAYGKSGVGKTALLRNTLTDLGSGEGKILLAYGKYDQNPENDTPFSGFSSITSDLVEKTKKSTRCHAIRRRIEKELVRSEIEAVSSVFPVLRQLFDVKHQSAENMVTVANETSLIRFLNIYRRMLGAWTSRECPVVFFIDDLQWVDDATRKLLVSIMNDTKLCNLLIAASIRDDEENSFTPPSESTMKFSQVTLLDLEDEAVNQMVSYALGCDPDKSKGLSRFVFARTLGNPCFVRELLEALCAKKLVAKTVGGMKWDAEAITKHVSPSASVLDTLIERIRTLDNATQLTLVLAATLGHNFSVDVLESVMSSVELLSLFSACSRSSNDDKEAASLGFAILEMTSETITRSLKLACNVHLLDYKVKDKRYYFIHDRVQESALSMLPSGICGQRIKASIGCLLLEFAESGDEQDRMLHSAANLLIANPMAEIAPLDLAKLCRDLATLSLSRAAFTAAIKYSNAGIEALGNKCWKGSPNYVLCLELYNLSAESYFSDGRFKQSERRVKIIQKRARSIEDRFRAFNVLLNILMASNDFEKCVSESHLGLDALGFPLSKSPSLLTLTYSLVKTRQLVRGRSPHELESLPQMADAKAEEACALLPLMLRSAYCLGDSNTCAAVSLLLLQLTLRHGLHPGASNAIASYGLVVSLFGNLRLAYDLGESALRIAKQKGMEAGKAEGMAVVFGVLHHIGQPMVKSFIDIKDGVQTGLQYGDSVNSCILMREYVGMGINAGHTMPKLLRVIDKYCELAREYRVKNMLKHMQIMGQAVRNLCGKSSDPLVLKGTFVDEKNIADSKVHSVDNDSLLERRILYAMRMMVLYICGDFSLADEAHQRWSDLQEEIGLQVDKLVNFAYGALNCIAMATCTKERKRKRSFLRLATKYTKKIQTVAAVGSPTSLALLPLLQAEMMVFHSKKVSKAIELYGVAIERLRQNQMYLFEAVAYERLGLCLKRFGHEEPARVALLQAFNKFRVAGVNIKLDCMRRDYQREKLDFP